MWPRSLRWVSTLLAPFLLTTCLSYWSPPDTYTLGIVAVDEAGQPIPFARVDLDQETLTCDEQGYLKLKGLQAPLLAVLSAPGYLNEPVALGWASAGRRITVRMFADGDGKRVVMHFGGDVMFGRRYEAVENGTPLIPADNIAQGASSVVEPIRRLFSLGDYRVVNLETVVSTRPMSEAYPGKRFLLRSHPEAASALLDLGVDVVAGSNNHTRDFLDVGVVDTLAALEHLRLPQAGAGTSAADAERPFIVEKKGMKIGLLSYTSVTGSFVNDNYPRDSAIEPAGVAEKEAWLWEFRLWQSPSEAWKVEAKPRRIGEVWAQFAAVENDLDESEVAKIWQSMIEVYPELQDWVARRGHGGAAMWDSKRSATQIAELKASVDLVIVQMHSGFQFQPVPSATVREAARIAVEAGADAVICHHPHVLQGAEWYNGKLIFYSLGNFIFDQDFLSTFASGMLRMIWEGPKLIDARFIPSTLLSYKPTPIVDRAADQVLKGLWERSVTRASSVRDATGSVRVALIDDGLSSTPSHFVFEHNTARITPDPAPMVHEIEIAAGETLELGRHQLVAANLGLAVDDESQLWIGRDLFGWGQFEDESVDDSNDGGAHWSLSSSENKFVQFNGAAQGRGFLRLHKWYKAEGDLLARSVARIPLTTHRYWQGDVSVGLSPADPLPLYTIRFKARLSQAAPTQVRVDVYHFDDTNPTEDPESVALASLILPFAIEPGDWTEVELQLDLSQVGDESTQPNMIMPYLAISAPEMKSADLDIDEFTVIEWREAAKMPDVFGAYDWIRNAGMASQKVSVPTLDGDSADEVED
jgi:poly-gamma-glutamate capsule biosynthesis protein CapA/YwtB (metallophosphatase superfamily)